MMLCSGNVTIIADGSEAMVIPEGANILAGKVGGLSQTKLQVPC